MDKSTDGLSELLISEAAGSIRLRARERVERSIGKTYGPKVAAYLRTSSQRILARLGRVESTYTAALALRESGGVRDVREAELPAKLSAAVDSVLDVALSTAHAASLLKPTTLALALGFDKGIRRSLKELTGLGLTLPKDVFSVRSPVAIRWVASESATLVKGIDATTRGTIRSILLEGIGRGASYQSTARKIKERFKVAGTFSGKVPGPKHIRSRAELIAVTEVGNAYEEGSFQASLDLHKTNPLEKSWLTVGDNRVSEMDIANAAQGWIPFERDFGSGHSRPLSHPGCRCTLLTRLKRAKRKAARRRRATR